MISKLSSGEIDLMVTGMAMFTGQVTWACGYSIAQLEQVAQELDPYVSQLAGADGEEAKHIMLAVARKCVAMLEAAI